MTPTVLEICKCRICGSNNFADILNLGEQALTGVFPKSRDQKITTGPLELIWCEDCSLLQLKQSYDLDEMYGDNYGYRSGLNTSMVRHLRHKVKSLETLTFLSDNDLVLDIGSNDGTLLDAYTGNFKKVGIDPTGEKFRSYYSPEITLISDFFTADKFRMFFPKQRAKIITSISMFYDLESPIQFVSDIESILDDNGIWHFEQSYMPSMLRTTAYDTVCHEHLEYYSLRVVTQILDRCGMRVTNVQMNAVNGGSFAVTACKKTANIASNNAIVDWMLRQEVALGLDSPTPYVEFARRVMQHRESLKDLIETLSNDGKTIAGYGASTKGNVLLQFCGLDHRHISVIAEVNEDKFGSYTPGSNIPIVPEMEARAMCTDYFLVLPWHFKPGILERERDYLASGGHLIFPLPEIEIV